MEELPPKFFGTTRQQRQALHCNLAMAPACSLDAAKSRPSTLGVGTLSSGDAARGVIGDGCSGEAAFCTRGMVCDCPSFSSSSSSFSDGSGCAAGGVGGNACKGGVAHCKAGSACGCGSSSSWPSSLHRLGVARPSRTALHVLLLRCLFAF